MDGRVAVVTSGTGQVGTEICRHLAAQGCRVMALYHPDAPEYRIETWEMERNSEGLAIRAMACDIADFGQASAVFGAIEARLGPVDVLVNNPNMAGHTVSGRMAPEVRQALARAHLDGVFNTTRCVIEGMLARGFGRIINMAADGRKNPADPSGVHGFTRSMAHEAAHRGVTVNTLLSGPVESPAKPPLRFAAIPASPGMPSEVANLVVFLAAGSSGFITGAALSIDGGYYMGKEHEPRS